MNTKFKYHYRQGDWDDLYDFESTWNPENSDYIAEEVAEDYFSNHDGWESSWPTDFEIFDLDGNSLGVYSVELEHTPTFSASKKEVK